MAARSLLLPLLIVLLRGWSCAQTINLQVSAIPATATRVVAVVDQGSLGAPQRFSQNVTAGVTTATLAIAVPSGGPYRVRAIAFAAGLAYPAILCSGKVTGVVVPNWTTTAAQITLAGLNAALDTATPSSAPAGSTVTLAANIADSGDTGFGASASRIYSLATPLTANQAGNILAGPFERQAEGVYRLSATIAAPPAGSTLYYQFAYNAWDFNDANKVEQPYWFWPNLNAGQGSFTLAAQVSSGLSIAVSGLPAAGNRIVAVVDGAALQRAVRVAKSYAAGASSNTLAVDVPAGGPYRVRVAAFAAGGVFPAILSTGKATALQAPGNATVALAVPAFALVTGTPASAPAGSSVSLEAALNDPGDVATGMPVGSVFSRTTAFTANRDGTESRGLLESLVTGSYRFSVAVALPASAITTYYQFAANAYEFNDPSGAESPYLCWPNLQAGQPLNQIASTLSSSIRINLSGTPANATRLIAVVDQGALTKPARVAASFTAGQPPANLTVGVPPGGPYRVRVIALRSGLATAAISRAGKASGVTVTAGAATVAAVTLADYTVALDSATPSSGTAGAQVTVIATVSDPGETASGANASRLYGSSSAFTQNLSVAPEIGLLEKNVNGTMKLTTPVALPGAGGVLYYQLAYEALDFTDADGVERPFFCWPNLEAGQSLNQIASNANPLMLTLYGVVTLNGTPLSGVTISLTGLRTASMVTAADGAYSFPVLPLGAYVVTATRTNFTFSPAATTVSLTYSQPLNFSVTQVTGTIGVSRTLLRFGATTGGASITAAQEIAVDVSENIPVRWTVASDKVWLKATPASGTGSGRFTVSLDPLAIPGTGVWLGTLTLNANTFSGGQLIIQVYLAVTPASGAPFGSFDTPADNATGLSSNVPVTGWALDDVGVKKVQIWRERVGTEPVYINGMVYIADAVFVPDARPDVAATFPDKPNNYRAGWGYLLLTNFLPNPSGGPSGNGTYRLHVIATDEEGKQTELGVKTITVDNANAAKPFGTIDTPAQGATISGAAYINYGWALTPQPFKVDETGAKMWISIDGVFLGHLNYNHYRSDIAAAFPAYANSGGGVGYYILDTTKLSNGIHNIGWLVSDTAGRTDGIGSRYFFVRNTAAAVVETPRPIVELGAPSLGDAEVEEMGRVELQLPPGAPWSGHLVHNGDRVPLPAGSTLDSETGAFVWQMGAGFLGEYALEFVNASGVKTVRVVVRPLGSARNLTKQGDIRF